MMDPRTERRIKSAKSLTELLRAIAITPQIYAGNDLLSIALKSQGGMAKYADAEHGIVGSSINCLKCVANEQLSGGWVQLDHLRIAAVGALAEFAVKSERAKKNTKASKDETIDQLTKDVSLHQRTNLVLLRIITQTIDDLTLIAEANSEGARKRLISESIERARASLLSNRPPFDKAESPKVVPFENRS